MSETGSLGGGSHKSAGLKGWTQTTGALRAGGRDDLDVSRSSTRSHESYSSANALRQALPYGQPAGAGPVGDYPGRTRPGPSSSPGGLYGLPSSMSRLERPASSMSSGSSPSQAAANLEDQLKQERSWWSVHMMGETHEVERNVKEELHKTVNALREKFMGELESQRNDSALRASQLERSMGNLGGQIDALRERCERQEGGSSAAASVAPQLQQLRDQLNNTDRTFRLELSRVSASLEDFHRVQAEILNTLHAQQDRLEADGGVRTRLQEEVIILQERLRSEETRRGVDLMGSLQTLSCKFEGELLAALSNERAMRTRELDCVREEARRYAQDLLEHTMRAMPTPSPPAPTSPAANQNGAAALAAKVAELQQLLAAEQISRKLEADSLRSDFLKEREHRGLELSEARAAWSEELYTIRAASDLIVGASPQKGTPDDMKVEVRFIELEAALDHAKQAWKAEFDATRTAASETMHQAVADVLAVRESTLPAAFREGVHGDTAKTLHELYNVLQAEVRKRTAEADELRAQIGSLENVVMERSRADEAQDSILSNVTALDDRLTAVARDLDNERGTRRGDVERVQLLIQDVNETIRDERKLRGHEFEKFRLALADLATSIQAALNDDPKSDHGRGLKILGSIRTLLDGELVVEAAGASDKMYRELAVSGSSAKRQAEATAQLSDFTAAFGQEVTDVLARIQGLRGELRAEFQGNLQAVTEELRHDIGASCHDVHRTLTAAIDAVAANMHSFAGGSDWNVPGAIPVERKAELLGNLTEVTKLVKIISDTCDHLGLRLQTEKSERKAADGTLEVRIASVEKRLFRIGAGEEVLLPDEREELRKLEGQFMPQHQHLIKLQQEAIVSENLKNSFEKLLGRLNSMLRQEDVGLGSGINTPASQRGGIRTPMSIASSIGGGGTLTPQLLNHPGRLQSASLPSSRLPDRQRSIASVRMEEETASLRGSHGGSQGGSHVFTAVGPQFVDQTIVRPRELQDLEAENAALREELMGAAAGPSPKMPTRNASDVGVGGQGSSVRFSAVGNSPRPDMAQQPHSSQPFALGQQQVQQQALGSGSSHASTARVRPMNPGAVGSVALAGGTRPAASAAASAAAPRPGAPQRIVTPGYRAVTARPPGAQVRPAFNPAYTIGR